MALPVFLVMNMRLAFRTCARQYRHSSSRYIRCFSSTAVRRADEPEKPYRSRVYDMVDDEEPPQQERRKSKKELNELATREEAKRTAVTNRRVPVPLKVIPRAQLGPDVTLTPRQRLHVEMITRRPPEEIKKKIFRERLQIYHMGTAKEHLLTLLKVSGIVSVCALTFVIAPAHLSGGTAPWIVALLWLGGWVPGMAVNYMTKSWVNRVFLDLPEQARESPKAAMEYAKNLPSDATIEIMYLKPWGLEGSVKASTSDLVPIKGSFMKPLTFTWKEQSLRQRWSRLVPTSFFVEPESAVGGKSVNTVPGIWESVYNRIVKEPGKPSPKWQSPLEPYET